MRYALIEGGQAREIFPGQPFTARVMVDVPAPEPAEGEEPGEPNQEVQEFLVIGQWLDALTPGDFDVYGIKTVMLAAAPLEDERVVSTELVVDGVQVVEVATYEAIPAPVLVIPAKVSRLQAKMALAAAGTLAAVDAAVNAAAAAPGGEVALLYWNDASDFHRNHYLVEAITSGLGMSAEQVDSLFVSAASLAVM